MNISLDQQFEMLYTLLLLYVQFEIFQNILKLKCWPLAFTLSKAFLKKKMRPGISLPALFSARNLKKNLSHVIFYKQTKFYIWLHFLLEIFGKICIEIICYQLCDVINFEINLSSLIKTSSYVTKKVSTRLEYLKSGNNF